MTVVKTVNIIYYPDNRMLRYQSGSAVSISGDSLSTKFKFIIPSQYSSYVPWIEFQIPMKSEDGTLVSPQYVLDSDYAITVPAEVTSASNGKLITFNLKFVDSDDNVVEKSTGLSVYVDKSVIIQNEEKYLEYTALVNTESQARVSADNALSAEIAKKSTVTVTPIKTSGTAVATITVDGVAYTLYI